MTKARRLPLPVRRQIALTDRAHDRLRALNARHGLSNNYLLAVLLEQLDDYADGERRDAAFASFIAEYGAPAPKEIPRHG
ncbi:MAG: hypothetical protein AAF334_09920 [Pseudomonadota bacterium]